jgi:hypothetical protein
VPDGNNLKNVFEKIVSYLLPKAGLRLWNGHVEQFWGEGLG